MGLQGNLTHTQRWIIFAFRTNWSFSSVCVEWGCCLCLYVSECVCHESARGDRSICPVMRPCKLVWSEKPVQICVAALCVSHWISVKVETAGTSHLTAPLFCWWWGKDESSCLLWPLGTTQRYQPLVLHTTGSPPWVEWGQGRGRCETSGDISGSHTSGIHWLWRIFLEYRKTLGASVHSFLNT